MAGAQVTVAASCIEKQRLGYQAISLTNFTSDTLEPAIAAGSKVEIGSALFEFAGNESITGLAGIANSSDVYIHLTVTGASVAASGFITAPTWSDSKQGWYSGDVRVIGGLYKDASGNYARKWLYEEKQIASVKRFGNGIVAIFDGTYWTAKKRILIGDWNMDSTEAVYIAHGLTTTSIRSIEVLIRGDNAANVFPLDAFFTGATAGGFYLLQAEPNKIVLVRAAGGAFDSAGFDSTSYNRGWINIEYEP
jgi:hypothetical protein